MSSIQKPQQKATQMPEYGVWSSMKQRCNNPNTAGFERYGGRGIKVCERWNSFSNFIADMGPRPSKKHQIDRIDNDGNYCPENCRWVLPAVNIRNSSHVTMFTFRGKTQCAQDWADEYKISRRLFYTRMDKLGWSFEDALLTPVTKNPTKEAELIEYNGKSQRAEAWAEETGIKYHTIRYRIRTGWPVDQALGFSPRSNSNKKAPTGGKKETITLTFDGRTQFLSEWAKELGVSKKTLKTRYYKGWLPEQVLYGMRGRTYMDLDF